MFIKKIFLIVLFFLCISYFFIQNLVKPVRYQHIFTAYLNNTFEQFDTELIDRLKTLFGVKNTIEQNDTVQTLFGVNNTIEQNNIVKTFGVNNTLKQTNTELVDKLKTLLTSNSFYKQFNISYSSKKIKVNLLVIVSSAPVRYLRREYIRKTWWKECKNNYNKSPSCIFMTDKLDKNDEHYETVKNESESYKDIHMQNLNGGSQFGIRYIYHLLYALSNYEFDYFLRIDDDYFLCFDKLLFELPMPPVKQFYWSWIHLESPDLSIRRSDNALSLLSKDLIITFIEQNESIMCHHLSEIMLKIWMDKLKLTNIYRHDYRLHHMPRVKDIPSMRDMTNICSKYIGIHGAYPYDMRILWKHRGKKITYEGNLVTNSVPIDSTVKICWSCIGPEWTYEPSLCINNPKWDPKGHVSGKIWKGRE